MQKTDNYELNLPEAEDFFSIEDFNDNTKKIDEVLESLENPEHDTGKQAEVEELASGESLKVALRKLAKSVADYISHKADKITHITAEERTAWNAKLGVEKIAANLITDTDGMVLAAAMGKNLKEQIDANANAISILNSNIFKNSNRRTAMIDKTGWYRVCETNYDTYTKKESPVPYVFGVGLGYYTFPPMNALLAVSECYNSAFLEKICAHYYDSRYIAITKVRITGSASKKCIDVYINTATNNYYSFEATSPNIEWVMDYIADEDAGTIYQELVLFE